ncbi:S24/S26 family peptidase [Nocardioides sp. CBS4Y-1]|uniref:S24/S26 family peptidase n=2 Tax=Nocardioides acrostichi TaxID=2784339 RepID=A0A930UWD4_9ACTN|nr:S24/S26 family peptidase [Nocardioides acrostichi]
MLPTLRPSDRLLVVHRRAGAPHPRAGGIVVARFVDGTLTVKRCVEPRQTSSGRSGWWLLSDNPERGVDSRHRGPVADDAVLALVVGRLWPRPRVRLARTVL